MKVKTLLIAATLAGAALAAQAKDIVDTAVAAANFKTLVVALKAADLVPTLKGKGPFTVFEPTDEAFAKASLTPSKGPVRSPFLPPPTMRSPSCLPVRSTVCSRTSRN